MLLSTVSDYIFVPRVIYSESFDKISEIKNDKVQIKSLYITTVTVHHLHQFRKQCIQINGHCVLRNLALSKESVACIFRRSQGQECLVFYGGPFRPQLIIHTNKMTQDKPLELDVSQFSTKGQDWMKSEFNHVRK